MAISIELPSKTKLTEFCQGRAEASRSSTIVFVSYGLKAGTGRTFREAVIEKLRRWVDRRDQVSDLSQRHFWRFVEYTSAASRSLIAHELGHALLSSSPKRITQRAQSVGGATPLFIVDGQQKLSAITHENWELSGRVIRSILETTLDDIESLEDFESVGDILDALSSSFAREVAKSVKWADRPRYADGPRRDVPSNRRWVLSFILRTGNPPPALGRYCPATGRAIVVIFTEARREGYAAVQEYEDFAKFSRRASPRTFPSTSLPRLTE